MNSSLYRDSFFYLNKVCQVFFFIFFFYFSFSFSSSFLLLLVLLRLQIGCRRLPAIGKRVPLVINSTLLFFIFLYVRHTDTIVFPHRIKWEKERKEKREKYSVSKKRRTAITNTFSFHLTRIKTKHYCSIVICLFIINLIYKTRQ